MKEVGQFAGGALLLPGGVWVPQFPLVGGSAAPQLAWGCWWRAMSVLLGRWCVVSLLRASLFFKPPVTCVDLASAIMHVKGQNMIKHH